MSPSETLVDNRRLVVRLASHQILNMLGELADRLGMDLIETLVHGAVWTANTEHLLESTGRYARLLDLPPDSLRRPIGEAQLLARLRLPRPLLESYIERLIQRQARYTIFDPGDFPSNAAMSMSYDRSGLIGHTLLGSGRPLNLNAVDSIWCRRPSPTTPTIPPCLLPSGLPTFLPATCITKSNSCCRSGTHPDRRTAPTYARMGLFPRTSA